MKIWFDLSNSPHINMFAAMVSELRVSHEVIITCRPLANTIALLDLHGLPYTVIGRHYGRKLSHKVLGFGVRVKQLREFLAPQNIDVAISQSSFHSPVVARLLGVRCLYLNDNEHALGNVPAFRCADRILVPEFLPERLLRRQYAVMSRVIHYPGIKEGIYLWQHNEAGASASSRSRAKSRPAIYIRPEPWTAQYYKGRLNFMDRTIVELNAHADVTILPRGQEQASHYLTPDFDGVRVVTDAIALADITPDCDLFIGAGGTMTREMAVLGIPAISVYQDRLLEVDKYLVANDAMLHNPTLTAREALDHLGKRMRMRPRTELLEKGRAAYALIRDTLTDKI